MLPFKSKEAFFGYCNDTLPKDPKRGVGRPAVVPPQGYMDIENHVTQTADGRYRASIVVCGAPAGFFLISETPNPGGSRIEHGDLLVWQPFKSPPLLGMGKLGKLTGDKRSSWIGFIVAKIAPEIDAQGNYVVVQRFP
jgi:hypothetical protein